MALSSQTYLSNEYVQFMVILCRNWRLEEEEQKREEGDGKERQGEL